MVNRALNLMLVVAVVAVPGGAVAKGNKAPPSPMVAALANCRTLTVDAARLACFDKTSAALIAATESGDVSVVDRASLRAARRSLFGFAMPRMPFFAGDSSADEAASVLESTVTWSRDLPNGLYQMRIADGDAVWETTEAPLNADSPRKGDKIIIKRGPLGSYILRFGGQGGIKGRRVG